MSLPKHINLAGCVPDPHGRVNHIYHAKTDEVLHVSPETAKIVADIVNKADNRQTKGKPSEKIERVPVKPESVPVLDTGLTLAETQPEVPLHETDAPPSETESETAEAQGEDGKEPGVPGPDRAELLAMAESLELTLPEGISDADLLALVEAAVQE